ncbi:hypothetical protein ACQ4PT_011928 [Festuca glaucescens]
MGGRSCLNLLPCSTSTPCRASAAASSCRYFVHHHRTRARVQTSTGRRGAAKVSCSAASGQAPPSQSTIKVVIVGATKEIGRAAIAAVSMARGMELAGAIDSQCIGEDAGEISGMEEALEIPVLNDLTMVLGSIAQSRGTGVVVDFSEPSLVYDNIKQAAAFGLSSIVYVPKIEMDTVTELSAFCEKASMDLPSQDAIQIANNISDLGQIYNREDMDSDNPIYTLKHDVTNVRCLMPGLILAIRKVIRLKNLIYGLEKFL